MSTEIIINKEQVKEELEKKQLLEIQKQLSSERKKRFVIMSYLLSALLLTVIYGTLENPFLWTFSKIGNRFSLNYRLFFIIWASYTGFSIQASILTLMKIEGYKVKKHYIYIIVGVLFLFFTSLAPSLPEFYKFWYYMHLLTSFIFALLITLGFYPFAIWLTHENPRLRQSVYVFLAVTWGGSIFWYLTFGNRGLFEMWFFLFFILFLLYLSLTLFEERIVKLSIKLLRDEENLNIGIEKIFIDLEEKERRLIRKSKAVKK